MPVLGITGGVATGKTSFSTKVWLPLGADRFDSDAFARTLVDQDPAVREQIAARLGHVFLPDGSLNRAALRERVFRNESDRLALQQILHPRIRARWTALAQQARDAGRWLVVDIPLLFETRAESHFDRIVAVGCSAEIQRRRLLDIRGLNEEIAAGMIAAQLDLKTKMDRAHHAVWNGSSLAHLREQALLLAHYLLSVYG